MLVHTALQCIFHNALGTVHQALVLAHIHEAPAYQIRSGKHLAGLAVHGGHDDDKAVLGEVLAVPQHHVAHIAHAKAVHHDGTSGHRLAQLHLVLREDNVGAVFRNEDVAGGNAQTCSSEGVLFQLLILAVHGQEVLGLGQGEHQLLLLLTGVTGNVHIVHALVDDLCAQQQQTVDDLGHALFVAGDGVGGDDDEVAGAYPHLTVAAGGHTAQRAERLALTAGGHQHYLLRRVLVQLVYADQGALRDVHIAQLLRHGGVVDHAAAAEGHLAAILHGQINDLLHAVDVGRKGCNDNALIAGAGKQAAHTGSHLLLGSGKARALRVGGVAQQSQHTALPVLGQGGQVGHAAGQRGVINFKVAGLDDGTGGAVDGKGHGIRDGVVDVDRLHGKAAQLDLLPGHDLHKLGLAGKAELLQLVLDQAAGQAGAVHRQADLLQQIGNAANVILVAVGDEQALDLILVLHHKGEVRDDHVHAEHLAVREHQAAVHDDHIAVALVDGHVLADLAQTAQRVDMDGGRCLLGLLRTARAAVIIGTAGGGTGTLFPCGSSAVCGGCLGRCRGFCAGCGVIFLCLSHSLPPDSIASQAAPRRGEQPHLAQGKHLKLHRLPVDASYRIYRSARFLQQRCWFRKRFLAM